MFFLKLLYYVLIVLRLLSFWNSRSCLVHGLPLDSHRLDDPGGVLPMNSPFVRCSFDVPIVVFVLGLPFRLISFCWIRCCLFRGPLFRMMSIWCSWCYFFPWTFFSSVVHWFSRCCLANGIPLRFLFGLQTFFFLLSFSRFLCCFVHGRHPRLMSFWCPRHCLV